MVLVFSVKEGNMGVFLRWYSHNLKKHQFAMNMVTTGTVFFAGDILSQQVRSYVFAVVKYSNSFINYLKLSYLWRKSHMLKFRWSRGKKKITMSSELADQ